MSLKSFSSLDVTLATPMSITPVDTPSGSSESLSLKVVAGDKKGKTGSVWSMNDDCPCPIGSVTVTNTPENTSMLDLDMKKAKDLGRDVLPPPAVAQSDRRSTLTQMRKAAERTISRAHEYTMVDIDPARCPLPLSAYCFMTGFVNAVCYSSAFIWPAFHTGNVVQMSEAVARLLRHPTFHLADQLSLTSLLTFLCGAFFAGHVGHRIGHSKRAWLFLGTLLQALATMAAALCAWKSGQPVPQSKAFATWTNALSFAAVGFMSVTLGLQAVMSMRLKSQFGLTILMTGFWCELMSDPKIFQRRHRARDIKILAIFLVFLGGFSARAILQRVGAPGALAVGTGIRTLIAVAWLLAPAKPEEQS